MGELAVGKADDVLVTVGLGSCIGLALLDRGKMVAGLAHVMLPATPDSGDGGTPAKFADQAVPALVKELTKAGARK